MGTHTEAVQKLYVAYFGRPADKQGLGYWENAIDKAGGSTTAVSAAFAASAEYRSTFAGMDEFGIVDLIYHNLFGRAAEPAGLEYWANALKKHDISIDVVVTRISEGAQGSDKTVFANKIAGATAFTNALDTAAEVLGYVGENANRMLQKWLAGITTEASLNTALTGLDAFIDTLVTAPLGRQPSGLFESIDIATLPSVYDADVLATHNQAIELTASGVSGLHSLSNVAPSTRVRITNDMGQSSSLSLTQKYPGALKIELNEESKLLPVGKPVDAKVIANNATTLDVAFKMDGDAILTIPEAPPRPVDMVAVNFSLTGTASKLTVESSGSFVHNSLNYRDNGAGALHEIKLTGDQALLLSTTQTTGLALIDASLHLGGLTASLAALKDGGVIKLGSGKDVIDVPRGAGPIHADAIKGVEFFGKIPADAAQGDKLALGASTKVADGNPSSIGGVIANGVLTFTGSSADAPKTLEAAIAVADAAAETVGEVVAFQYQNDSYVFLQGGAADTIVRLVGTVGVAGLYEDGDTGQFMIGGPGH